MEKDEHGKEESVVLEGEGIVEELTICPDCKTQLQKCLIQQNYAMVICPNEECAYPFNQGKNIDNMVYVKESEVLDVAKKRLSND
ncbi:uncharacterized protein KNAG_0F01420 [Huiozyma naganishii CBS 8797]|uniref:Uncharacterized protein n=1 Tax=Huiozyma naganishii (strain ATCC MYA-139 / BCRC 22969 / CBS 8797 / KCTC 17520 / NBRC 10181 / NCYC 3082 / Yp74L-3) TaxID=1071383 RepID=J7R7G3_HUIN7|nr:hypothetical protein KNAG_0F01420 [Kazachstania naganishii CBS 8797]CCK70810.1 hypothetical protein KNAG_0F01420 [Kazachstania naganishii CBS 8797]